MKKEEVTFTLVNFVSLSLQFIIVIQQAVVNY